MIDRHTDRYLGGTGLHNPDWELRSFEVGIWIRRSEVGKGCDTEAVLLLAGLALEGLEARRIEITCDENNHESRRVAQRAEFVWE